MYFYLCIIYILIIYKNIIIFKLKFKFNLSFKNFNELNLNLLNVKSIYSIEYSVSGSLF